MDTNREMVWMCPNPSSIFPLKWAYISQLYHLWAKTHTHLRLSCDLTQRPARCCSGYVTTQLLPQASWWQWGKDRGKKQPREGREEQKKGEDRHIVMAADEGMNCRQAAVAVWWSKEDGGSGSSPVFPDAQADSGSRGRERGRERKKSKETVNLGMLLSKHTGTLPSSRSDAWCCAEYWLADLKHTACLRLCEFMRYEER